MKEDNVNQPLITPKLVTLDADLGISPSDVIGQLAARIADSGRATDAAAVAEAAVAREAKAGTGVNGRVAIPHCRSAAVTESTLAFARLSNPVDFNGPDGDAELVFLIAAPEGGGKAHLKILSKLARALVRGDFVDNLRSAASEQEIVDLVHGVVNAEPKKAEPKKKADAVVSSQSNAPIRIAAVTSCATGIAHTYMAADALTQAASKCDNVDLRVEPQGSSGGDPLCLLYTSDAADETLWV